MSDPTRPLAARLDQIIQRRPSAAETTPEQDDRAWMTERARDRCNRLFPARYTDATASHPEVRAWVNGYRRDARRSPSLLLMGPVGTGKTHQAYGALRGAVTQPRGIRFEFATSAELFASLRPRTGVDSEEVLRRYRQCHLLMLDDLGAAKSSEWVEEITYRLINGRYEKCLPSIFTTNLAPADLSAALGERIASRLVEMCTRVVLKGADRRRTRTTDTEETRNA